MGHSCEGGHCVAADVIQGIFCYEGTDPIIAGCVVQGVGVTQDAPQTVLVFINIDMQYWYSQT